MRSLLYVFLLATTASSASAQIHGASSGRIPASVARLVAALERDSATLSVLGDHHVGMGETRDRNIIVRNGTLSVAGEVTGAVVVLFGDLKLEPGAVIGGAVAVVEGGVFGFEEATVAGEFNQYFGGFGQTPERSVDRLRRDMGHGGHSEIELGIEGNYNRVEGLPIRFGPELRSGGRYPLRAYAYAILRTEPGLFDVDDMGYRAAIEQRLPKTGGLWLGGTAYSVTQPMDHWWFSDKEATIAAALYHEDLRDYYDRTGWMVYTRFAPERAPVDVFVGFGEEKHESAPLRDPWTLFRGGADWRLMPVSAEGDLRLIHASATLDLRRGSDFGTRGALLRTQLTHALDGTVSTPPSRFAAGLQSPGTSYEAPFSAGLVDARGYYPIANSILAARVVAAGSIDKTPLPPAYQSAMGGAGSLPGFANFSVNCGARSRIVVAEGGEGIADRAAFAGYGCDRVALLQAEYRSDFNHHRSYRKRPNRHDDDWDWWDDISIHPDFIVFFDAGRGWSFDDNRAETTTRTFYDAGFGIVLGDIGLFGAIPLTGENRDLRFFLRLGPRF